MLHAKNMRRRTHTPKQPNTPKIPTLRYTTTKIAKLQIKLENGNITPSEENTLQKLSEKYQVLKYTSKSTKSMLNQKKVEKKIKDMTGKPFDEYESCNYDDIVI